MHAETYGNGPSVIVGYHGWAGTHRDYAGVGRHLPERWRLIAPDLPGYGASAAPPRIDERSVVTKLVAHLDSLGPEPVTLSGYCSGAILALLVAEMRPEAVGRIVMIDPFAYVPFYFRIFTLGEFGRRAYRTTFASGFGRRVTDWALRRHRRADSSFTDAFRSVNHDVVLAYLRMFAAVGSPERFKDLKPPVTLCRGERTFDAVRRSMGMFSAVWPDAEVHVIGGGHLMMMRSASEIARILTADADA